MESRELELEDPINPVNTRSGTGRAEGVGEELQYSENPRNTGFLGG